MRKVTSIDMKLTVMIGVLALVSPFCGSRWSSYPFFRVEFQGASGWIIGGKSYVTRDGGRTWQRLGLTTRLDDDHFPTEVRDRVVFVDQDNGFSALEGTLSSTSDGGESWVKKSGTRFSATAIFFRDSLFGLGRSSDDGLTYLTTDGGRSWSNIGVGKLYDVYFADATTTYALNGPRLLRSKDGGLSWSVLAESTEVLYAMAALDSTIWLVGRNGYCAEYDDSRGELKVIELSTDEYLCDIKILSEKIVIVGSGSAIYVSPLRNPKWEKVPNRVDGRPVYSGLCRRRHSVRRGRRVTDLRAPRLVNRATVKRLQELAQGKTTLTRIIHDGIHRRDAEDAE